MKKVKIKHVLFSLIFTLSASLLWSVPILQSIQQKTLLTTQEDVEKIYQELNVALVNQDLVSLQKLLADGFQLETSRGAILSKQAWIREIQFGRMRYNQINPSEIKAIGRNSASVSALMVGEIWDNLDTWETVFHLDIVRKGKNVQIQRMAAKSVCAMNGAGFFDKNCQNIQRKGQQ